MFDIKRISAFLSFTKKVISLKRKNRDSLIFFALSGLGDVCYCLSVAKALKNQGGKKMVLFTNEYLYPLVRCYSFIDEVNVLSAEDIDLIKKASEEFSNVFVYNKLSKITGVFVCNPLTEDMYENLSKNSGESNYIEILQKYVFSKPELLAYPVIEKSELNELDFNCHEKTVIINPFSNSLSLKDESVYSEIIGLLKSKGYTVYTNIINNQKPLCGTLELRCNLIELYNLSKRVKLFVSIRSGILDFCIGSGGKFLVLYNGDIWQGNFKKAYSLTGWKTDSAVFEFDCCQKEKIIEAINKIC